MIDHRKCQQFDQCSVCCTWVDFNAGPEYAACPACPFRNAFVAEATARRRGDQADVKISVPREQHSEPVPEMGTPA